MMNLSITILFGLLIALGTFLLVWLFLLGLVWFCIGVLDPLHRKYRLWSLERERKRLRKVAGL